MTNFHAAALDGVLAIGGDDADTQLSLVIAALLGLALVILIATIVYWRLTRPTPTRAIPGTTIDEELEALE